MAEKVTDYTPKSQNFIDTDLFDVSKHVTQTSGALVIGKRYTILDFNTGDNFTNVANVISGVINTTGCVFDAIGTTPTTYSNGSTLAVYETQSFTYAELKAGVGGINTLKVSLTAAQIKTSFSAPIDIIAAPPVGYAIQILNVAERFNFNSVAFDNTTLLKLIIDTATISQVESDTVASISLSFFKILTLNIATDTNMQIKGDFDSTVGDCTMDFYIQYRIIEL